MSHGDKKTFSAEDRRAIVQEQVISGESTETFAARVGVSGRSLRSWRKRYAPVPPSAANVRASLLRMRAEIDAILAAMSCPAAAELNSQVECQPEESSDAGESARFRQDESVIEMEVPQEAITPPTPTPSENAQVPPIGLPTGLRKVSFDWDD